ncbi:ATP-binding protein [Methylobacterium flocculans]|uniref:ATP-binding protein n=1 Tax=Methylobacterium flocculans TaxID=2984843 RepID=UPI0021F34ABE|nr:ATP-binding protein [Methylobacterium sp. FF17]
MEIVDPQQLLTRLRAEPRETEWLEFKSNRLDHDEVGQYMSGLANAAMLSGSDAAYLVYGIDNDTHDIIGTTVRLKEETVGGQLFEHWLSRLLVPSVNFCFVSFEVDNKHIEIIAIDPCYVSPVRFKGHAFVRVDSIQQPLKDFPERERALWAITSRYSFEQGIAAAHLTEEMLFERFDCINLVKMLGVKTVTNTGIIEKLLADGLILDDRQNGYDATNLLAILAANKLSEFPIISTKAPRVIQYSSTSKLDGVDDVTGERGYGVTFSKLLSFIMIRVPHREEILHGIRSKKYTIPEISIREFVANALIHQDLTAVGSGPRVEIFPDKIRITNPGKPLVSPDRFIDAPAKSRNEKLAKFMRQMGLCEERGSGVDRAVEAIERAALPPPLFQEAEGSTVVTIFAERSFAAMTKEDRVRACYQHAQLRFESGNFMSNGSLRERFRLADKQYPQVSVVIREAIEAKKIRPLDEDQAKRTARYVPAYVT